MNRKLHIGLIEAVVAFVLAHEMAHHIHGDTQSPATSFEDSQKREIAADKWASETMIRGKSAPLAGCFAFLYFAALDSDALKHEKERYHPADARRLKAIIDDTIASIDDVTIDSSYGMSRQDIKDKLTAMQSELGTAIEEKRSLLGPR
jgi:hypothetical protein